MTNEHIERFFTFATFIEQLKKIERFKGQTYWKDYPELARYESVADHTWRLSILVLLFSDQLSQPFDLQKALQMALVHDLPEIIAGDESPLGKDGTGKNTHAFNAHQAAERHERERQAADRLFGMLPKEKAGKLFELWKEVEEQQTFEARVIKSLDKIEALLQVTEYREGHLFEDHLKFTISYGLKGSTVDPAIEAFGNVVVSDLKKKYRRFTVQDSTA